MSTFEYFGETFEYAEEFPGFEWSEFQEALDDGVTTNTARADGVSVRLAVACVAEKDQVRFRQVSRKNRAKVKDWMTVAYQRMAIEAGFPTGLPADSSDGHESTPQSSESEPVVSDTPDTVRPIRADVALALSRSA